jgi:DNA invertase Pin-like site-specific DNA recombinase
MSLENKEIKAVIYARVSTLLGQDPSHQTSTCERLAGGRGFIVKDTYVDEGISGSRERRPALNRLIKDARLGKFDVLIVSGIDRIARDVRHLLNLIDELQHYGVSLISVRESIDFTTPMGKATLAILGAIAGLERELTRERIRTALAAKKLAAERTGSGWRCGRPSKVNSEVVAEVKRLSAKGLSVRAIARRLDVGKTTVHRLLTASQKGE